MLTVLTVLTVMTVLMRYNMTLLVIDHLTYNHKSTFTTAVIFYDMQVNYSAVCKSCT